MFSITALLPASFPVTLWPLVPPHLLKAFGVAVLAFWATFLVLINYYPTRKKRAWLCTMLGSGFMTVASIPFMIDFLRDGGSVAGIRERPRWADFACVSFMAYLFSDLSLGFVFYREYITLALGWIHHTCYFLIVSHTIYQRWSHLFALGAAMELPTHLLALAALHPRLRSDYLFAATFFLLRLVFHVTLIIQYAMERIRVNVLGSRSEWVPACVLLAALPMHVAWFYGCVRGMIKRSRRRRETAQKLAAGVPVSVQPTPSVEKVLAFTSGTALDLVPIPSTSAPLTPPTTPFAEASLSRVPSLRTLQQSLPPSPLQLRRRLGKEGRAETMRRLGDALGRGRGVVQRVRAEVMGRRVGVEEREMEMPRQVMAF